MHFIVNKYRFRKVAPQSSVAVSFGVLLVAANGWQ